MNKDNPHEENVDICRKPFSIHEVILKNFHFSFNFWSIFYWTLVYMVSLTGRPFVDLSYGTCRELFIFTHWTNYVSFAPFLFVIHVLIKIWRELFMGWIVGPLRTPAASLVARPNLPICLVSVWNRKEPERDKNTVWSFGEIHIWEIHLSSFCLE